MIELKDLYEKLEFKYPKILVNPYGIKIYIGTKDKDDWCIVVPKEIIRLKHRGYSKYDKDFVLYFITEQHALEVAKTYTDLAKANKK